MPEGLRISCKRRGQKIWCPIPAKLPLDGTCAGTNLPETQKPSGDSRGFGMRTKFAKPWEITRSR